MGPRTGLCERLAAHLWQQPQAWTPLTPLGAAPAPVTALPSPRQVYQPDGPSPSGAGGPLQRRARAGGSAWAVYRQEEGGEGDEMCSGALGIEVAALLRERGAVKVGARGRCSPAPPAKESAAAAEAVTLTESAALCDTPTRSQPPSDAGGSDRPPSNVSEQAPWSDLPQEVANLLEHHRKQWLNRTQALINERTGPTGEQTVASAKGGAGGPGGDAPAAHSTEHAPHQGTSGKAQATRAARKTVGPAVLLHHQHTDAHMDVSYAMKEWWKHVSKERAAMLASSSADAVEAASQQKLRAQLKAAVFHALDSRGAGHLHRTNFRILLHCNDFFGTDDEWSMEYERLLSENKVSKEVGVDEALWNELVDGELFCSNVVLIATLRRYNQKVPGEMKKRVTVVRRASSPRTSSFGASRASSSSRRQTMSPDDLSAIQRNQKRAEDKASPGEIRQKAKKMMKEEIIEQDKQTVVQSLGPSLASVKFEVVRFSSQKDPSRHAATNLQEGTNAGNIWESQGPPEQWLVLDLGFETEICGVQLRCTGTQMDPKDMTVMRGSSGITLSQKTPHREGDKEPLPDGPWVIVRRCFVEAGPGCRHKQLHRITFEKSRGRYFKLIFHETWGTARRVRLLNPLVVLARPQDLKARDCEVAAAEVLLGEGKSLVRRPSLTTMFSEAINLSPEEREMRIIARKHGIPLDYAEAIRDEFHRFDVNGKGSLGYLDFGKVVRTMTVRRAGGVAGEKGQAGSEVPESRIRYLWHDVDTDGSGRVELEEFLIWFYRCFHSGEEDSHQSPHSDRQADSVTERFYAALGSNRLRNAAISRNTTASEV
mmetsp:Transcript_97150/g.217384  ORF Transcript_97150/g.217384 Transcript_97150/m.217384 type:complete len:824 (-) Transcript_97150:67-2538(-)